MEAKDTKKKRKAVGKEKVKAQKQPRTSIEKRTEDSEHEEEEDEEIILDQQDEDVPRPKSPTTPATQQMEENIRKIKEAKIGFKIHFSIITQVN